MSNVTKQITALNTECKAAEIDIYDEVENLNSDHTWTAKCHDKIYECSEHSSSGTECTDISP